ncbi:MAG: hypothetical protein H8D72_00915 [Planctomycetes bacterium]|nr:hypothetical protein [Planctomycetota bacterium]
MGPTTFGQALLVVDPKGRVLTETQAASNPDVALPFLQAALARAPKLRGPALDPNLAGLALAEKLVDRGELDAAWPLAEELVGLDAARLRARILRLRKQGVEALAELDVAREESSGAGLGQLELERVELLLRLDRLPEARVILTERLAVEGTPELLARGLLLRGVLQLAAGDVAAAKADWQRVTDELAETRWAPLAAVALGGAALELGIAPDFAWPAEDALMDVLYTIEPAPVARGLAKQAAKGALDWLLAAQRADGSFVEPSEVSYPASLGANPFEDATTALAGRALLAARAAKMGDSEQLESAAERVRAYIEASLASRATTPPVVAYMDYMTWSDGAMLQFLAELQSAELTTDEEVGPLVALLLDDLADRQQANGGWSYYKKNDLSAADVPAQSISFTTAAGSLALSSAREAGYEVPEGLSERSTRTLEELRDQNGVFGYFLYGSGVVPHPMIQSIEGDVGRGPACELALYRAGASDPKRVAVAIDLFLDHASLFQAEQGKSLMHGGPHGQGCPCLLFDYAHAARAAAEASPRSKRTRARLLDLVLDCRQADGSFLDSPILGRSYGTAMALLALVALD